MRLQTEANADDRLSKIFELLKDWRFKLENPEKPKNPGNPEQPKSKSSEDQDNLSANPKVPKTEVEASRRTKPSH